MHDTNVKMKDGREYSGSIWEFRPREGWFSLTDAASGDLIRIALADVESAVTGTARTKIGRIETRDELARAKEMGFDEDKR